MKILRNARAALAAAAAVLTVLGTVLLGLAGPAGAIIVPGGLDPVVQNTQQASATGNEAGFYAFDNGQTRFRYVQAELPASLTLENFIGPVAAIGAAGVELCDPTTHQGVQAGLIFNPNDKTQGDTGWEVHYATGTFTPPPGGGDACVQGGILNPGLLTSVSTLLTGDALFADGSTSGNGASQTIPEIGANDVLQFSIYYTNPTSGSHRNHDIQIQVVDLTQDDTVAQVLIPVRDHSTALCSYNAGDVCFPAELNGQENFLEAGIGLFSPSDLLTGGTVNEVATFSDCAFNYYSSRTPPTTIVSSHWRTREAQTINASNQVVMSPTELASLGGPVPGSLAAPAYDAFDIFSGSTSP